MLDLTTITKLSKPCKVMANIIQPDVIGIDDKGKRLFVAPERICGWAQNIIDQIPDHAHLKGSKILLLIKVNPQLDKKMKAGEVVVLGQASKPGPVGILLTRVGGKKAKGIDFIITLSGDWLRAAGVFDDDYSVKADDMATIARAMGLIDHELMHCSAEIAGQFISKADRPLFLKDIGARHIETCEDVKCPDTGDPLVRYYTLDTDKKFKYKMRRHDIEEFFGIIDRWGNRNRQMSKLIDVLKKNEKTLFGTANAA